MMALHTFTGTASGRRRITSTTTRIGALPTTTPTMTTTKRKFVSRRLRRRTMTTMLFTYRCGWCWAGSLNVVRSPDHSPDSSGVHDDRASAKMPLLSLIADLDTPHSERGVELQEQNHDSTTNMASGRRDRPDRRVGHGWLFHSR